LRNDTKMAEVPLGDEAPLASEVAETHEGRGEYSRQLYDYVQQSLDREESFHFLGFEMLQRLNIAKLQYRLAEIKVTIKEAGQLPINQTKRKELKTALAGYIKFCSVY
jgi:hypothetical protein